MADAPLGATAPAVPRGRFARVLAGLLRFFGLWVGITGLYSLPGAICPCCGHSGCQVGWGGAAILGALGSLIVLKGRALLTRLRRSLGRPEASP